MPSGRRDRFKKARDAQYKNTTLGDLSRETSGDPPHDGAVEAGE